MTVVMPSGAHTEIRYGSAQVAELMPTYDTTRHTASCMPDSKKTAWPGRPSPNGRAHH